MNRRTKDHCSIVARQNIVDLKAQPLDHGARVIDEISDSGPGGLLPDPGKNAGVARDYRLQIFAKQPGDFDWFGAAAHATQKLLCEMKTIVLAHSPVPSPGVVGSGTLSSLPSSY